MPEDPQHPRIIRFNIENVDRTRAAILEFDTVESARDWRRDFSGRQNPRVSSILV